MSVNICRIEEEEERRVLSLFVKPHVALTDPQVKLIWKEVIQENGQLSRQLVRKTFGKPKLKLVPHVGYVSFFPFMSRIIPPVSFCVDIYSIIHDL